MKGLIDIHCHILPGIDDGANDLEEALAMAKAAWKAGISEVIATPHFEEAVFENYRDTILEETEKFKEELKKNNIPIIIHPGCEIMLTPCVPELIKEGKLLTLKDEGEFVLVELPRTMWPMYTEDILYEIKLLGITPIIAHPERYREVRDEVILDNLIQFNLGSLIGKYGRKVKAEVGRLKMLKHGEGIFYGTDSHKVEKRIFGSSNAALLSNQLPCHCKERSDKAILEML